MEPAFATPYLAKVMELIHQHGWALQGVGGDDCTLHNGMVTPADWMYTIGMFMFDHPEFIITGLDSERAGGLLNDLGERVRAGERFDDGMIVEKLLADGYKVLLRAVSTDEGDWFNVGRALLPSLTALQVIWPDKDGSFPPDGPNQPILNRP